MAFERHDYGGRPSGRDRQYSSDRYATDRFGRDESRGYGGHRDEERGFFERAGDEIASWFGGEDEDRRHESERGQDRWRERERGSNRSSFGGMAQSGMGMRDQDRGMRQDQHWDSPRSSREIPRGEMSGQMSGSSSFDPHYHSWRERQIAELDRDYDEYRREHQSRFENEFGSWREKRQSKRSLLRGIREHMDVVGNDEQHVGTVDRVAGDRIILTKSDPESGGAHHSLSCSDIDRIEENRIILECTAEDAKKRWRDESRSRALFEREDQGEMGPRILDRSFEGTYR
jgi:hypothetical protein